MPAFAEGCAQRGFGHLFSHLLGLGRHCISNLMRTQNLHHNDWSAHYRLYSRKRFDEDKAFGIIRSQVESFLPPETPLIVAMDDTLLKKSGRKIHGSKYFRDPLSPPFHTNLVRSLRYVQFSAAIPSGNGDARMVPIGLKHAPLPEKPGKKASQEEVQKYEKERKKASLNRVAYNHLKSLREAMDQAGPKRRLITVFDNRFTNAIILKNPPKNTDFIGRLRKDTVLFHAPDRRKKLGRKPTYGSRAPTPQELLKDQSISFKVITLTYRGQTYTFQVKQMTDLVMRMDGGASKVQVIAIKAVGYRLKKGSRLLYREPAFLVCTDRNMSLEEIIQAYLWRWDIEVNFRDEKTLLGVGQAQVRTAQSNQLTPSLAVAAYALLLIAGQKVYGANAQALQINSPKWYNKKPTDRPTTQELINQLRIEMWAPAINREHFSDFSTRPTPDKKSEKFETHLASALFSCTA